MRENAGVLSVRTQLRRRCLAGRDGTIVSAVLEHLLCNTCIDCVGRNRGAVVTAIELRLRGVCCCYNTIETICCADVLTVSAGTLPRRIVKFVERMAREGHAVVNESER